MTIVLASGIALFFGLGQLRLQFALNDLQRETAKLQARKMDLHNQINSVRGEVEARKQGEQLLRYAVSDLGMIQYPPSQWERMTVAPDLENRYADAQLAGAWHDPSDESGVQASSKPVEWMEKLASRAGLDGSVFAQQGKQSEVTSAKP